MANIIGTIVDIDKILGIEDCNILCEDGTGTCGDALDADCRCEDCQAKILGECLHPDLHLMEWEIKEMCDNCGKCEWLH